MVEWLEVIIDLGTNALPMDISRGVVIIYKINCIFLVSNYLVYFTFKIKYAYNLFFSFG